MKKTTHSFLYTKLIYVFTTIFLVALSTYTFALINNLIDSSHLVAYTHKVNLSLQKISAAITEAETNQRAYLLAGDSVLLSKKNIALNNLNLEYNLIAKLVKDNPEQIQNLQKLQHAIQEKLSSMKNVLELYTPIQTNPAFKAALSEGVENMDSVKQIIYKMSRVEIDLLQHRTKTFFRLSAVTPFFIIVLFLGALLILSVSYFRLTETINHSHQLQNVLKTTEIIKENEEKLNIVILQQKNEELEKMNKELELFAHISSHDLQEPLRKIQISISRFKENGFSTLTDKGKGYFKMVEDAAIRMQALIEDLLAYARINNKEGKFIKIDLNTITQEVIDELKDQIDEKNATIVYNDHCEVYVRPFEFRQLMYNLIGNALKFSKPDQPPYILIRNRIVMANETNNPKLLPGAQYCNITISDNGIGFEPHYTEKIFEVFQRLHSKEKYKGTGMGLAIVKKIVTNHNGIITANAELNQGATFEIYLPIVQK